jgi:hypothetical protein
MSTQSVYIAGPMSNQPMWNYPAFFDAEEQLLELGYVVGNPARHDGVTIDEALRMVGSPERPAHPWAWYMKRDLPMVMGSDFICLLPGWQESKGARLEVHVAKALGIPLMILRDGKLVPRVEVVGLSGWARSGKDTVADYLVENYGFTKMSFAEPMREALTRLNPLIHVSVDQVYSYTAELVQALEHSTWEDLKSKSPQIRPYLQRFGTEVGRQMFGEDFWVDYAIDRIPDGAKVVFADTRFRNEANAIQALGGKVWRVVREGVSAANDHISEHDLDSYEFNSYIRNYKTLEYLYEIVDRAVRV